MVGRERGGLPPAADGRSAPDEAGVAQVEEVEEDDQGDRPDQAARRLVGDVEDILRHVEAELRESPIFLVSKS